jgi:hypothetical protein
MARTKRSGEALARRAEKKEARVLEKNKFNRLEQSMLSQQAPNWMCPNESCKNDNFARRRVCNLCGAPNPNPQEKVQREKQPRPKKAATWQKNATPADRAENLRLREMLEKEIRTGIKCEELVGEDRKRAEVCYNYMLEKRQQKQKQSKRGSKESKEVK